MSLFLTSKVRLHCDRDLLSDVRSIKALFLTSKARLHCDHGVESSYRASHGLFLTSKARLHCDHGVESSYRASHGLFLTSKVRLHCDRHSPGGRTMSDEPPFPDLKGQAPLRRSPFRRKFGQAMCFS